MKLAWNNIKEYFKDNATWQYNTDLYWYRYVWEQLETVGGYTEYNSTAEILAVYNRIYALIKIYKDFCQAGFGESPYFDVYFNDMLGDEETEELYASLVEDDAAMYTIFDFLKAKMGVDLTFAAMWLSCINLPDEDGAGNELPEIDTYEDYKQVVDDAFTSNIASYVFSSTVDSHVAYEWLATHM